ncbi:MAG: inositol monophosphatase family protein [Rhodocyclaceae bacterium]|nr:inositol monophosphatase family protein [Rhodocyclaceae bacterium]
MNPANGGTLPQSQFDGASRDWERALIAVKDVAQRVIMSRYLSAVRSRKADGSFLTEVDLAAQCALIERLKELNDKPVLGEEMTGEEQHELWRQGQDGLWCVDPIDGTTNFANGIPFFAVSVAYMEGGKSEKGVVYNPATDEAFYAERGRGAWLNGTPLPLRTPPAALGDCVAGVDFKRIAKPLSDKLATHPPYYSQRNFGSSALEWCYVAAGRLDVHLHGGQKLWDYAAGRLILEEAGGALCTLTHDDFDADDLWKRSAISAVTPALQAQWRNWIRANL